MNTTRTITHDSNHTDIETYLQDADGVWMWAVTQCNGGTMTAKMTQLEYAKTYAPASRIPESFLTMGDVVEMLERIEELKAEVKNLDEGARLMHSLAMNGEQSALSRLDKGVDVQDAVNWQDEGSKTINLNGYKATATASWRERHLNES